jgi:arsenite methyltransferase
MMTEKTQGDRLKQQIREHYAERAVAATSARKASCCASADPAPQPQDELARGLYALGELGELPDAAVLASLGCGNPTALAQLAPGEFVLDLGSGGGIDVLLSARRVGPEGKAYGLDMTDEMLALARENQRQAGVDNVEFLKGEIENIPLPDDSVDVIISNCVINLSTDKDRVFAEAFRVLKPGGRFAVSDMVFRGDLALVPESVKADVQAWAGCVAGALEEQDYLARLRAAGFENAAIEVTQTYDAKVEVTRSGADQVAACCGGSVLPAGISLISGFVRATKPKN